MMDHSSHPRKQPIVWTLIDEVDCICVVKLQRATPSTRNHKPTSRCLACKSQRQDEKMKRREEEKDVSSSAIAAGGKLAGWLM